MVILMKLQQHISQLEEKIACRREFYNFKAKGSAANATEPL